MITVRVLLSGPDQIVGFEVTGHSGFARSGTDIVCAAVSILAENLGASIENLTDHKPIIRNEDGFFSLRLDGAHADGGAAILISSAYLGFRSVAERYPENVRIESVQSE